MSIVKIRQSQIITTYGPGALVDLPDYAIIVAGLGHWGLERQMRPIHEPRLLANLRHRLNLAKLELKSPPVPDNDEQKGVGIVGFQFPEWFVAQYEVKSIAFGRSRPLVHRRNLVRGRYVADDTSGKKKNQSWPVVPIRFVQGCPNGHVSDINWPHLVHGVGAVPCGGQLWLDERGTTGDLTELFVRCDGCGNRLVPLVHLQSTSDERSILGPCRGDRPWLGPAATEPCTDQQGKPHRNRLLIRHASNAYFPLVERAISIPDHDERLRKAVDAVWEDFLSAAESAADVKHERKKARVAQTLEGFTDEQVWAECVRRQANEPESPRGLKDVELDTFFSCDYELGEDQSEADFYAKRLPLDENRVGAMAKLERVVLVHRLREVVTEIGFTRFESPAIPVDSEVDLGVKLASLDQDVRWLPAVENRGEGVFLSLEPAEIAQWLERPAVRDRAREFECGVAGLFRNPVSPNLVLEIYMPYILLHSLSHLLMTAVALECGYSTASIRERIYVRQGAYGLLLYTGTPDAEGTLGGLVQVGRRIERHLETALELGRLCSNDPVCAQHRPSQVHEGRLLHGASCHGCLLIAEPSCERRNELLDRSLVVPTVDCADLAFFGEK